MTLLADEALPKFCYYLLPTDMVNPTLKAVTPVIIKRGEKGYYCTDWVWNKEHAQEAMNDLNARLGVTKEQLDTMTIKSMFHWKR